MDIKVRKLNADDYDEIIRIWAESGLPFKPNGRDSRVRILGEMARSDSAFFGLFENGRMLGVGLASFDGRKGWIQRVAVDPDHRGIGLASHILDACEEFLQSCGAEVISCLIEDLNSPSMECFRKHGYVCWPNILYFSKRDSGEA
jgi:ribosomal protein S18 acetylase RimI-like enzyme